jgi:hypothetical protein
MNDGITVQSQFKVPSPALIQQLRQRDGTLYVLPQQLLTNLLVNDAETQIFFPLMTVSGEQVGWMWRKLSEKLYMQDIQKEHNPRFFCPPNAIEEIWAHKRIILAEGPFDALALATAAPYVISANTASVQPGILEWVKDWKLKVYTSFDYDPLKVGQVGTQRGQAATKKVHKELTDAGLEVHALSWPQVYKDVAQMFATTGPVFTNLIRAQLS